MFKRGWLAVGLTVILWGMFIASAQGTDWKYFYKSPVGSYYYYDLDSMERTSQGTVKVWIKKELYGTDRDRYVQPMRDLALKMGQSALADNYDRYFFSLLQYEIKCADKRVRLITYRDYDNNDKVINPYASSSPNAPWHGPVHKDSPLGALAEVVCP